VGISCLWAATGSAARGQIIKLRPILREEALA
jgi:hypothetical protein